MLNISAFILELLAASFLSAAIFLQVKVLLASPKGDAFRGTKIAFPIFNACAALTDFYLIACNRKLLPECLAPWLELMAGFVLLIMGVIAFLTYLGFRFQRGNKK